MLKLCTGDAKEVLGYLINQLREANKKLKREEGRMAGADCRAWRRCQIPWQYQNSLIHRYQSALVKLISNAIQSTNHFHREGLLHLDIKGTLQKNIITYVHDMCMLCV